MQVLVFVLGAHTNSWFKFALSAAPQKCMGMGKQYSPSLEYAVCVPLTLSLLPLFPLFYFILFYSFPMYSNKTGIILLFSILPPVLL